MPGVVPSMDTDVTIQSKAPRPDNSNSPSDFPTDVGNRAATREHYAPLDALEQALVPAPTGTGATLQHYAPIDRLEQAIRHKLLKPNGIKPPKFMVSTIEYDPNYIAAGNRAKTGELDGTAVLYLPLQVFRDHHSVALALTVASVKMAMECQDGYLREDVREALERIGVHVDKPTRCGAGRRPVPRMLDGGALSQFLADCDPECFTFFKAEHDRLVAAETAQDEKDAREAADETAYKAVGEERAAAMGARAASREDDEDDEVDLEVHEDESDEDESDDAADNCDPEALDRDTRDGLLAGQDKAGRNKAKSKGRTNPDPATLRRLNIVNGDLQLENNDLKAENARTAKEREDARNDAAKYKAMAESLAEITSQRDKLAAENKALKARLAELGDAVESYQDLDTKSRALIESAEDCDELADTLSIPVSVARRYRDQAVVVLASRAPETEANLGEVTAADLPASQGIDSAALGAEDAADGGLIVPKRRKRGAKKSVADKDAS